MNKRLTKISLKIWTISIAVLALGLVLAINPIEIKLSLGDAKSYEGYAKILTLPSWLNLLGSSPDSNRSPSGSSFKFLLNGTQLSPHALHVDLFSGERGFSHWGNYIIFSSGRTSAKTALDAEVIFALRLPFELLIFSVIVFSAGSFYVFRLYPFGDEIRRSFFVLRILGILVRPIVRVHRRIWMSSKVACSPYITKVGWAKEKEFAKN